MSVLSFIQKRQSSSSDKYYARREDWDPVLRAHLHLKPPEPQETCPFTGKVKVNGEWLTKEQYKSRYPDFSEPAWLVGFVLQLLSANAGSP